jgi:putative Holliday junction resolvase
VKPRTRLLGIDLGTVRIGLAVSDSERRIASPLEQYRRGGRDRDLKFFQELCEREEIGSCVIGLPLHLSGREGDKAKESRAFAGWLAEGTGLAAAFWDERFTTVEAEHSLMAAGLTNKKRKARRDQVAAQILLQSYLDAGCPAAPVLGPLEGE